MFRLVNDITPFRMYLNTHKLKQRLLLLGIAASLSLPTFASSSELDWQTTPPDEQKDFISLFSNQLKQARWQPTPSAGLCHGIVSPLSWPTLGTAKLQQTVIRADKSLFTEQGTSELSGNVTVARGYQFLSAEKATLLTDDDTKRQTIELSDNIRYVQPDLDINGQQAVGDLNNGNYDIDLISYLLPLTPAWGTAKHARLTADKNVYLNNATFTTCPPGSKTWKLYAKKIKLDSHIGRGYATHIWLKFKETPLLYLPYLNFPLDDKRKTGFLYPSYGSSSRAGFEITTPYYWNIAPNQDALFNPSWTTDRGIALQSRYRLMTSHSRSDFQGHYVPSDRAWNTFSQDKLANFAADGYSATDRRVTDLRHNNNSRYGLVFTNKTQLPDNWQGAIRFQQVSDSNYFKDWDNRINASNTNRLQRFLRLDRTTGTWRHSLLVENYQTLNPYFGEVRADVYRRQPAWETHYRAKEAFLGTYLDADFLMTHFSYPRQSNSGNSLSDGYRVHLHPRLRMTRYFSWGSVSPEAGFYLTHYDMSLTESDKNNGKASNTSRFIPTVSLKLGSSYAMQLSPNSWYQLVEPLLYYRYTPYKNQNKLPNFDAGRFTESYDTLFMNNRFTGYDRIGDYHSVSFGLTTRFLEPNTGVERLKFSVAQAVYFADRRVTLCDSQTIPSCANREQPESHNKKSNMTTLLRYTPSIHWQVDGQIELSEKNYSLQKGTLSAQYNDSLNRLFYFGHDYLSRDPAETEANNPSAGEQRLIQSTLGFALPLSAHWRSIGLVNYDWDRHNVRRALGGIEYNTCCLSWSLAGGRQLIGETDNGKVQYDHTLYFQATLKGLGSTPDAPFTQLIRSILPDYRPYPAS